MKDRKGNNWFTKKHRLQMKIAEYVKRRQVLRNSYGTKRRDWLFSKDYSTHPKRLVIEKALNRWRRQLKRIIKLEVKLNYSHELIKEYFHVRTIRKRLVIGGASGNTTRMRVIHGVFCKYVIETYRIESRIISDYLGSVSAEFASRKRLYFSRSFKDNKINFDTWKNFIQFVENKRNG